MLDMIVQGFLFQFVLFCSPVLFPMVMFFCQNRFRQFLTETGVMIPSPTPKPKELQFPQSRLKQPQLSYTKFHANPSDGYREIAMYAHKCRCDDLYHTCTF